MRRCGFFVEERIKSFTLKLNKYKEDFMKDVNNTKTNVAKRNKMKHLFMKKVYCLECARYLSKCFTSINELNNSF